ERQLDGDLGGQPGEGGESGHQDDVADAVAWQHVGQDETAGDAQRALRRGHGRLLDRSSGRVLGRPTLRRRAVPPPHPPKLAEAPLPAGLVPVAAAGRVALPPAYHVTGAGGAL